MPSKDFTIILSRLWITWHDGPIAVKWVKGYMPFMSSTYLHLKIFLWPHAELFQQDIAHPFQVGVSTVSIIACSWLIFESKNSKMRPSANVYTKKILRKVPQIQYICGTTTVVTISQHFQSNIVFPYPGCLYEEELTRGHCSRDCT